MWSLSTETLFALTEPNTLSFRWNLDEEVWDYYKSQLGITGQPSGFGFVLLFLSCS